MRWFKYIWIAALGFLWILWTIAAINELITRYKKQDEKYDFFDAFVYVFEWGEFFTGWFIANTLSIVAGSFIVWLMSIVE